MELRFYLATGGPINTGGKALTMDMCEKEKNSRILCLSVLTRDPSSECLPSFEMGRANVLDQQIGILIRA